MEPPSSESQENHHQQQQQQHQNVIVMRHGDRKDNFEPLWVTTAERPWDPPLVEEGQVRAFCTGRKIRNQLGFPIHRVFVSHFVRCIETASKVVSAQGGFYLFIFFFQLIDLCCRIRFGWSIVGFVFVLLGFVVFGFQFWDLKSGLVFLVFLFKILLDLN